MAYSAFSVVPNIGGSSELIVNGTPAATNSLSGCDGRSVTARVAMFDDGHTSRVIPSAARWASSTGSDTEDVPCPIRSAPSSLMESQTVSGPVVSPACGTECRPAARAASKCGRNCERGTPISGPPRPKPTSAAGPCSSAWARVASAAGIPDSPGMS